MRTRLRRSIYIFLFILLAPPFVTGSVAQKTVILVRHAEKMADAGRDPELTAEGQTRSEALADALEHMKLTHVISSQFKRTLQTATPAADRADLEIEVIGAGTSEEALTAVVEAVGRRKDGETILVVGHSNTIPRLVTALGGPTLEDLEEHEYDSIYVLEQGVSNDGEPMGSIKMIRLRFGVPNG
jgi:broad specificity phosphatase PhoE